MATSAQLKEIRDTIFSFKDTADRAQKGELKKILRHELKLLNKNM